MLPRSPLACGWTIVVPVLSWGIPCWERICIWSNQTVLASYLRILAQSPIKAKHPHHHNICSTICSVSFWLSLYRDLAFMLGPKLNFTEWGCLENRHRMTYSKKATPINFAYLRVRHVTDSQAMVAAGVLLLHVILGHSLGSVPPGLSSYRSRNFSYNHPVSHRPWLTHFRDL